MRRLQIPTALALSSMLLLAATAGALAKDDVIVTFDSALPTDPEPGSEITIGWTVETPGRDGQMEPFNAEGMFVRLIPATGDPVEAIGRQGPPGHYVTTLTVPASRIVDVEAGLRGESCSGGTCQPSDILFSIEESTTGEGMVAPAVNDAHGSASNPPVSSPDIEPLMLLGFLAGIAVVAGIAVTVIRMGRFAPRSS